MKHITGWAAVAALVLFALLFFVMATDVAACESTPITANTPSGIAGCERWGAGTASHYGPGDGVAMNFCTWALRHSSGCGWVTITSAQSGQSVSALVIDFCDCWTGTPDERIVDLQYGVVAALGLDLADGLYPVSVQAAMMLPDTATR